MLKHLVIEIHPTVWYVWPTRRRERNGARRWYWLCFVVMVNE